MAHNPQKKRGLPSPETILEYLKSSVSAGEGKREISRHFGLSGAGKIALKARLKEMEAQGLIEKSGKRLVPAGRLPNVLVIDITHRGADGDLIGHPAQWDEDLQGPAPELEIVQSSKGNTAAGIGSKVLARVMEAREENSPKRARVMKIINKQKPVELGVVRICDDGSMRVTPVEKRKSEMLVGRDERNEAKNGDLVEVSFGKQTKFGLPRAKIERIIGSMDNEFAVSTIALHAHNIPHIFDENILAEANAAKPINDFKTREDWRNLPLITIDPTDAKDHDDAVHAIADTEPNNPGGFICTVAIADVAHYVTIGSAMDREALHRGNSVYFPDRVVPMLPERISNDLCSLRELEDKPALAVRMVFDAAGQKRKHSFHRIVMRSHAKLSYNEAQNAIDGQITHKAKTVLENALKPLWQAYECLKKGRDSRAPLEIDIPERKILLKKDGTIDRVEVPPRLDAHKLIEEFMIQANVCAAQTLEAKKQSLIYRIHDGPTASKLETLSDFLKSLNMKITKGGGVKPAHFNGILKQSQGQENQELVNTIILRSQSQAIYDVKNIGHFGLNLQKYAHFTSPIRRYADLTVHRALINALRLGSDGINARQEEQLPNIAADISNLERRAMSAERETKDRLISQYLSTQIGAHFAARISGVTKAGLFVCLSETGADGFVPIRELGDEYFIYDEMRHLLVGEHSRQGYQLGDLVEVKLIESTPLAGALRFEMISEGTKAYGLERTRPTGSRKYKSSRRSKNHKRPINRRSDSPNRH